MKLGFFTNFLYGSVGAGVLRNTKNKDTVRVRVSTQKFRVSVYTKKKILFFKSIQFKNSYFFLSIFQVNQYEDANGSRPFAEAPDDLVTEVALKWFEQISFTYRYTNQMLYYLFVYGDSNEIY